MSQQRTLPRFFYITGCDGTGKTTQARLLVQRLEEQGVHPIHLWLRFPFFFCTPLLIYARMRGYSWYEKTNKVTHGYWDFRQSFIMRYIFPWLLLLDATLSLIIKIRIPLLFGHVIVCERFSLDMLIDLAVSYDDHNFIYRFPGQLFIRLLPRESKVVILDLDAETIRKRRVDLRSDKKLNYRIEFFRTLTMRTPFIRLSSKEPITEINNKICIFLGIDQ
jgi:thymidylate kinase